MTWDDFKIALKPAFEIEVNMRADLGKLENYHDYTFFSETKHPFSQWHKIDFVVNGVEFSSAEQFMMYGKALLFEDSANAILNTRSPHKQKILGRKVGNFNQSFGLNIADPLCMPVITTNLLRT